MKTFCQLVHFFHPHVGLLSLWFMVSYIATQMYPKCTSPKTIWYDSSLYNRFHLPSVDMYWKAGYYVKNYILPLQCEDLKQPCEFAIVQMWYHKAVSFGASILKWTYRKNKLYEIDLVYTLFRVSFISGLYPDGDFPYKHESAPKTHLQQFPIAQTT